jgi:hypothetical protein
MAAYQAQLSPAVQHKVMTQSRDTRLGVLSARTYGLVHGLGFDAQQFSGLNRMHPLSIWRRLVLPRTVHPALNTVLSTYVAWVGDGCPEG